MAAATINSLPTMSPKAVMKAGLTICGVVARNGGPLAYTSSNIQKFRAHYGSSPLDLASMWHDLKATKIPRAKLRNEDKGQKGFRMFMVAHYFLWVYPKNAGLLAGTFKMCKDYVSGKHLWEWVARIAALKQDTIVWSADLDKSTTETIIISVDGVHFKIWEPKHPSLPKDKKFYSHKFNHAALSYEIAVSIHESNIVWINGPFPAGEHDMTMFRKGLSTKMQPDKWAIVDGCYQGEHPNLIKPNQCDSRALKKFKSRVRMRHEIVNGRMKHFDSMSETFRHGISKHKLAFEAVSVTVQYQMNNGTELFAV